MRLSLLVEFVDCDMTRQFKNLETLWSFAIFNRVPIIKNKNSLYRLLHWKSVVKKKNKMYTTKELGNTYSTHSNYYEIFFKSSKLGNIMRVEILTLNWRIKDGLKIVSKTKMKKCLLEIDQGLHCA